MKINGFIVVLLILLAAFLLNPGYSKHMAKLGHKQKSISRDNPNGGSYTGSYKYNNYYIFSTTTDKDDGERKTIGIFGFVFE